MNRPFFLHLLELSALHATKSREGFQALNLSEGIPKVIYILAKKDGMTQKELAAECKIRESTLAVMLSKMEELGTIYKEKDIVSGGKRAFRVHLSEEGRKLAEQVDVLVTGIDALCTEGFSEEEKEQFFSYMERAAENLKGKKDRF